MERVPTVFGDSSLEELQALFEEHELRGLPVVDDLNRLIGVVSNEGLAAAIAERADLDQLKSRGIVGGDEIRSMPFRLRAGRRLSWLSLNIVLTVLAASVIALHEETLTAVIALAVFLPIVSDMSGCSGNQAVGVSLRELALGIVKPYEFVRVWFKEASVGVVNGLVLGVLLGAAAWLWKGNPYLGVVVGGAFVAQHDRRGVDRRHRAVGAQALRDRSRGRVRSHSDDRHRHARLLARPHLRRRADAAPGGSLSAPRAGRRRPDQSHRRAKRGIREAIDLVVRDITQRRRQQGPGPAREPERRRCVQQSHNPALRLRPVARLGPRPGPIREAVEAVLGIADAPTAHSAGPSAQRRGNGARRAALRRQQHNPRPPGKPLLSLRRAN